VSQVTGTATDAAMTPPATAPARVARQLQPARWAGCSGCIVGIGSVGGPDGGGVVGVWKYGLYGGGGVEPESEEVMLLVQATILLVLRGTTVDFL
jgi:hypothetical protein